MALAYSQNGQALSGQQHNSTSTGNTSKTDKLLQQIRLPDGFRIDYFANQVPDARSLAINKQGTVFVSTRSAGKVYALIDRDKNGQAEQKILLASGLNMPNGIAVHRGDLYIAEVHRILVIRNIEKNLRLHKKYLVAFDGLPSERHHGWRYIRFGPDGMLYIAVGAPCNICDQPGYAKIKRINLRNRSIETVAHGVRNSVGFDWHPNTGKLWFSDNGRDLLGDDIPADEINQLNKVGDHFGYPYCHGGTVLDPKFGHNKNCADYRAPEVKLNAHVAPLGIRFYTGKQFPANYRRQLFVAEHGSWNRSTKIGYRVLLVRTDGKRAISVKPFATGWLKGEKTLGRPVDFLNMPDGSLLISDDFKGVIYRITYSGN